jgi:ATP-dependent Clp protease ATP-binding subunit ClpA
MFERFTDRARKTMALANLEAQRFGHEYIGTEHILLGMIKEGGGTGATALTRVGLDLQRVRLEVEKRIKEGSTAALGKLPQTAVAKKAIEFAIVESRELGHRYVGTEHMLLGLIREPDGLAGRVLRELGVTLEAARASVVALLTSTADDKPRSAAAPGKLELTDRARKTLALANQEAQRFNHEYIGTEHILLGLVKEGSGVGASVLKNLDVDLRKVRVEVEKLTKAGPAMVSMGKLPQTPRAKMAIEYAVEEARTLGHNYVGTEHLLLGLLREHDGVGAQVLRNLGLKLEEVREEVLSLLGATETSGPPRGDTPRSRIDPFEQLELIAGLLQHASEELLRVVQRLRSKDKPDQ